MRKRFLGSFFFVVVICIILIWLFNSYFPLVSKKSDKGKIVSVPLIAGKEFSDALNSLKWANVAETAEALGSDPKRRNHILDANTPHPPAIFLQALLALSEKRPDHSLEKFSRLKPEEIPPEMLFAPYRLHATIHPNSENPYKAPLMEAVKSGKVPPLIIARMNALEGELSLALKAYLRTDPGQWASLEIGIFRNFRLHAGLRKNATAMIAGALRGGKITERLKPHLMNLLPKTESFENQEELKNSWLKMVGENPEIQRAALKAAEKQLSLRKKFVEKKYQEILKDYSSKPLLEASDETVLLVTLAAAKNQDRPAFSIWSQELERRHSDPEVQAWLEKIRVK